MHLEKQSLISLYIYNAIINCGCFNDRQFTTAIHLRKCKQGKAWFFARGDFFRLDQYFVHPLFSKPLGESILHVCSAHFRLCKQLIAVFFLKALSSGFLSTLTISSLAYPLVKGDFLGLPDNIDSRAAHTINVREMCLPNFAACLSPI